MTHTKGLAGDSPELIKHIEALKKMNVDIEFYLQTGDMIHSLIIQISGII